MKKLWLLMIVALLFGAFFVPIGAAAASSTPTFKVNGKLFLTPAGEPSPYINKDNRTMGSLRLLGNALGVPNSGLKWDQKKQVATLTKNGNTVSVTVGKKVISVNGKNITMDTVAELKQGRVFIPARFIAQGLGVTIKFESATNSVLFFTGDDVEIHYDNFEEAGFIRLQELPFTQETSDGLKLTVHSAYLYKTSSAEAKALQKKYNFTRFDQAKDILFLNITLENNTGKIVQENYHDMNPKVYVATNWGVTMIPAVSRTYREDNDKNYLRDYRLENGETYSTNIAFFNLNEEQIDFIGVEAVFKAGSAYERIAEKVN